MTDIIVIFSEDMRVVAYLSFSENNIVTKWLDPVSEAKYQEIFENIKTVDNVFLAIADTNYGALAQAKVSPDSELYPKAVLQFLKSQGILCALVYPEALDLLKSLNDAPADLRESFIPEIINSKRQDFEKISELTHKFLEAAF